MSWLTIDAPALGFLGTLSQVIGAEEEGGSRPFPSFHHGSAIVVASDYGGEHPKALWATYAFLVSAAEDVAIWASATRELRRGLLPDGRVFEHKGLGDRVRRRGLPKFLRVADSLPAVLLCFAVPTSMGSLFASDPDKAALLRENLPGIRSTVAEKLLRVTHLLGLLLAGFSRKGQDVLWISDEDSIAVPTEERLSLLTRVLAVASSHVLSHDLRHLQVATSRSDPGDLTVSDLLSLPDLAAGMTSDLLGRTLGLVAAPPCGIILSAPRGLPRPVDLVVQWFGTQSAELRKLLIVIDQGQHRRLRASRLQFWT